MSSTSKVMVSVRKLSYVPKVTKRSMQPRLGTVRGARHGMCESIGDPLRDMHLEIVGARMFMLTPPSLVHE
jgi:hypothetical protein